MINKLFEKYLTISEQKEFMDIIKPIYESSEFRQREKFPHHDDISLVEHILEVAILTYKECKKDSNVDLNTAVYIAMMHDLYTVPWQNNKDSKVKHFFNKHGFRHPIEAVINSINWYPEIFNKCNSEILIDGIIHHMFPLPVRVYSNDMELKNSDLIINENYKKIIIKSTSRKNIGVISICRSKYKEGRIVSKCDKKVSFNQIKNIFSLLSLITGKNKNLKSKSKIDK